MKETNVAQRKYKSVKCPCGNVLTVRNVRSSGMAVCRCGNNYTREMFDAPEPEPRFRSLREEFAGRRDVARLAD